MKKHLYLFLSVFFIFCIGFSGFYNTAEAIEYSGIGGRPAYPRPDNPRTDSIFIHTLAPGVVQEEGIRMINNTEEIKTLTVHAVDSIVSSGGAFACRQKSEPKESVGNWIILEKNEVTLEPMTTEVIPFTINVPADADVGEHNGCLVIQEKKEKDENQTGVGLSFRTGLRVAITIPGEIVRELEITDFRLAAKKDGGYFLTPFVKNKGNVSVDADVKVVTSYFFGMPLMEHGGSYPLLKGEVSDWNFELQHPFWGGWYTSYFTVEYDKSQQAQIGINSGEKLVKLQSKPIVFFVFPTLVGLAIELVVICFVLFLLFLLILSKKRKNWIKNEWNEYTVQATDQIKSIAKEFDVSWKLLVDANKLQPPYILDAGTIIKVPPKPEKKEKKAKKTVLPAKKTKTTKKKVVIKKKKK